MTHGEKIDKALLDFPEELRPQIKRLAGTIIDIAIFELTKEEYPQYFNDFAEVKKPINKCPHNVKTEPIFEAHPQCDITAKCSDCGAKRNRNGEWDA